MNKILLIFLSFFIFNSSQSIETKIVHNIQGEIITNIDIKNEFKYLLALNNNLKNLEKKKILDISNESIIREKIKKIEILKNYNEIKIDEEYLQMLIKNAYLRLGLKSPSDFALYLKGYDLILSDVEKKISIDALWNELILQKYSSQVKIDEDKIEKEILESDTMQSKEYLLSEIIFEIDNKEQIDNKYQEIVNSIDKIGFENSASIYSFSQSSKIGGDIGWISDNSINNKIKENISRLKIGEISKPIILSNGILILKVINTKKSKIEIDYKSELKKAINYEKNRQLNQYSKIYFNKVKKNLTFNE